MLTQAELWELRPQGTNPCRNVRRYKVKPRERFLSVDELNLLGFVLDHTEDAQAAAAIRLLLFTGARSSEITGLRWDWIRGTRALLPDTKTGPRTISLSPESARVLAAIPRVDGNPSVIPERIKGKAMRNLNDPWDIVCARAGLEDMRIHDARHTYASPALAPGESLPMIGQLLGHPYVIEGPSRDTDLVHI